MYRVVNYKNGTTPFETYSKAKEFQMENGGKIYMKVASCTY